MTKLTEILEQGLTACSKYEQDEQFQLEIARVTLKRLENEIVRSDIGSTQDANENIVSVSRNQLLRL